MDGWIDRSKDLWNDGWIDGMIDGLMYCCRDLLCHS